MDEDEDVAPRGVEGRELFRNREGETNGLDMEDDTLEGVSATKNKMKSTCINEYMCICVCVHVCVTCLAKTNG
jgi:hypothetical protein